MALAGALTLTGARLVTIGGAATVTSMVFLTGSPYWSFAVTVIAAVPGAVAALTVSVQERLPAPPQAEGAIVMAVGGSTVALSLANVCVKGAEPTRPNACTARPPSPTTTSPKPVISGLMVSETVAVLLTGKVGLYAARQLSDACPDHVKASGPL